MRTKNNYFVIVLVIALLFCVPDSYGTSHSFFSRSNNYDSLKADGFVHLKFF
jgi:hypothetical protein